VTSGGDFLQAIVAAADGTLWFLDQPRQSGATPPNWKLGRITTDGQLTSYGLGSSDRFEAMIPGPDGNLWLYDFTKNAVLKVLIKDGTVAATFPMPVAAGNNQQNHFVIGPDGNLWMTHGASSIARIKMDGTITEYSVPTAGGTPTGLNVGGDGNLWFTEYSGKIGQLIVSSATDSGQATINESDPILGTSAITLVSLPGTVPSSTSSLISTQGTVHAQDDNPCVEHTDISTHSENGTVVEVKITVPPQKQCADLSVNGYIAVKLTKAYIVSTSSVHCSVKNNGPSAATMVETTCNATGGFILSSAKVTGDCTFNSDADGYVLKSKSLAKDEICTLDAGIDLSTTQSNVLTVVGTSETFDPDMSNNASVYLYASGKGTTIDKLFVPLIIGPIQRGH
jgi:hypothetical protein